MTKQAHSKLSCNVQASLLMTSHGWQQIRTTNQIFGVHYDGNKTFLKYLGGAEDRRRLQHHLVLIRFKCEELQEDSPLNTTFEPCAALRIGWAPGLDTEFVDQTNNKNNFIIIGLCLGILGLIYVLAVLIYLKVRKNRQHSAGRGQSQISIEAVEEETNCPEVGLRNAYINNLVQEAGFTTKSSLKGGNNSATSDDDHLDDTKGNDKNSKVDCSRGSSEDLMASATQPPIEFFVRIRGMIAAAKGRLNSFRYRPTLLVIPEDDYYYQDYKEKDIEASTSRKSSFRKFARKKGNTLVLTKKMESIHGSKLGAAMLEAKLAPPLPPPRNMKPKNKKRAPSPPGDKSVFSDYRRESPVSLKDLGGSLDRKKKHKVSSSSLATESYSKFDLFRFDLYEKINRMRECTETEVAVLEMNEKCRDERDVDLSSITMFDRNGSTYIKDNCSTLEYPSGQEDAKISRRELLYKLEGNEADDEEQSHLPKIKVRDKKNKSFGIEEEYQSCTPLSCADACIDDEMSERNANYDSRPSTAMSNSSARTNNHPPAKKNKASLCNRSTKERDDEAASEACSETSDAASLSGDSLNSSFRKPAKQTSKTSENLSISLSGSSIITLSTAIKEIEDYDDDNDDATTQDDDSRLSTDLDAEICSLDESEHPSLEEYLQLSSQVAKKLSERSVPAFSTDSPKEKNVISQFMEKFKKNESKPRAARSSSPGPYGADNWTLKKEAKVARKVSIFKRNPLKGRKNEEPLVTTEEKNAYFFDTAVSETDDGASSRSSNSSYIKCEKRTAQRYKNKTPEIIPPAGGTKMVDSVEKNESRNGEERNDKKYETHASKITIPRVNKAVTPPKLPPPKPQMDHLKLKNITSFNNSHEESDASQYDQQNGILETITDADTLKSEARFVRTPSIESDSISVANSDMTDDSLNTPIPHRGEDENREDVSEDENGPIDRCLAELAGSVIQPPDDCSLNRYLNHLGNVLATREELDHCLNKLASNVNGNRATKGFNLSHLPLCTYEHVCVDKGSDRSTPTSDRSSTTSRGSRSSQENLRKKTLTKSKHHHHHHIVECKHNEDTLQTNNPLENGSHTANGRLFKNGGDQLAKHILVERVVQKGLIKGKPRLASTSEEECGRASSLGSTRELETPIPETTSDPGSADLERPRKKRPLFRRSKKGLNGTCRQHIQNNKLSKKENGASRKGFQNRNSSTPRSSSSDVTVIQLGDSNEHVTNTESSNTFVTLINVDSSDCSNSAEEK